MIRLSDDIKTVGLKLGYFNAVYSLSRRKVRSAHPGWLVNVLFVKLELLFRSPKLELGRQHCLFKLIVNNHFLQSQLTASRPGVFAVSQAPAWETCSGSSSFLNAVILNFFEKFSGRQQIFVAEVSI